MPVRVKLLLSAFFILPFTSCFAQSDYGEGPAGPVKLPPLRKIIIFEDTTKYRHYIVREHDFIRYSLLDSAETLKGKIIKIHSDTLFLKHDSVVTGDIDKIVLAHSRSPHFSVTHSRVYLLPDSAYNSSCSKKEWKSRVMKPIIHRQILRGTDSVHKNFIKMNLARLLSFEIAFSYERKISRRWSVELELGYGFPVGNKSNPSGNPLAAKFYYPESFSVLAGPKYYRIIPKMPGSYLEFFLQFKDERFLDSYFSSSVPGNPSGSEINPHGDVYSKVYGFSFRFGTLRKYGAVVVDYYTGIGLKLKVNTYYLDGYYNGERDEFHYYNADHSQVKSEQNVLVPVFNLGLKLGFGF
ncbi:MAG: hypothetical protein WCI48_01690 [Bacteroidota bacterium]|jgi:hypothetical protein